jgi:large subunit ribosomal protein L4
MSVATFTKTGTKSASPVVLDKKIFGLTVTNHELLKQAYIAYMGNGRPNLAKTKLRGDVSGGGRKPWKQKGTGRARFGSSRNPIWRGGGVVFGPTGEENYSNKLSTKSKRQAIRQALSLKSNDIKVIESLTFADGKVQPIVKLLDKLQATRKIMIIIDNKDQLADRATRNIPSVKLIQATYVNVYDVLNSDTIIFTKKGLELTQNWLNPDTNTVNISKPEPKTKKKASL